jgi:predicted nucleic acid-binding protein
MIRVVIDTNIIVSALLQPLGPPAQVFSLAVAARFNSASAAKCMPSTRRSFDDPDSGALKT